MKTTLITKSEVIENFKTAEKALEYFFQYFDKQLSEVEFEKSLLSLVKNNKKFVDLIKHNFKSENKFCFIGNIHGSGSLFNAFNPKTWEDEIDIFNEEARQFVKNYQYQKRYYN